MEAQITGLIEGYVGIASNTEAIVTVIGRTGQQGKEIGPRILSIIEAAFVVAIGKQADVLKPQGRIFRGKLFAGINADIVTGNVIVRRLRDGMSVVMRPCFT